MTTTISDVLDLIARQDYGQAQEELKKLIALFPEENELYNLYGYCDCCIEEICEKEDFEGPICPVRQVPAPEKWEEWRKIAKELADKKDYQKASVLLGLVWNTPPILKPGTFFTHPHQPKALLLHDRAVCLFLMNDKEGAKQNYLHAAQVELDCLPPGDPARIEHLLKIKQYKEALHLLKVTLASSSIHERPNIYYKRYELYKLLGDTSQAATDLQDALNTLKTDLQARPLFNELYYKHANWLIQQGNFDKALLENAKAIALWPKFYGYHVQRAEIYARLGQKNKAQSELALVENGTLYRLESCRPAEKAKVYELLGNLAKAEQLYRAENIHIPARYDNLYDFYQRHNLADKAAQLHRQQRQEPDFQTRVSEREFLALF